MVGLKRFRATLGTVNSGGGTQTSGEVTNIDKAGGEIFELLALHVSGSAQTDLTVDILAAGAAVFTRRLQLGISGPLDFGPPAGLGVDLDANGSITIRVTNNSGSNSTNSEVVCYHRVRNEIH